MGRQVAIAFSTEDRAMEAMHLLVDEAERGAFNDASRVELVDHIQVYRREWSRVVASRRPSSSLPAGWWKQFDETKHPLPLFS